MQPVRTWFLEIAFVRDVSMWLDLTKPGLDAHNGKLHFSLKINLHTIKLTVHEYINAKCCLVCFHCGRFLGPVRRPRVIGWSSIGSGGLGKAANRLEIATGLAHDISHRFSNILWCFQHRMASYDAIQHCSVSCFAGARHTLLPTAPDQPPLCTHLWYWLG